MSKSNIQIARGGVLVAVLLCSACSRAPARPANDSENIVAATLGILASDGKAVCVDNRTTGPPLAIYAAMRAAPAASRRPLTWRGAGPLRPSSELSNKELYRDSLGYETAHLREPDNAAGDLSAVAQRRLDHNATLLASVAARESVRISPDWAQGVSAHWWPFNRVSGRCTPTYTLSNPVSSGSSGYISVMTEHWGTTYAFDRGPAGWRPVAQWTNWLY